MRGLPEIKSTESYRVRRWDAVFLGSSLPGLVAAVRVAMRGHRILVLEEAVDKPPYAGVREPFFMTDLDADGVLGACLRMLGIPLIDQRRFATHPVALQVLLPDARVDLGEPARTIDELVAWGLAKPEQARVLVLALEEASAAERRAMLSSPFVRTSKRLSRGPRHVRETVLGLTPSPLRTSAPAPVRGLPAEVRDASESMRPLLGAAVRALSNLGQTPPSPEARARLLGSLLTGGAVLGGGELGLCELLRRRIASLYGEFRTIGGPLRLVSASQQPGVSIRNSNEIWVGRVLVLNAPRAGIAEALEQQPVPRMLRTPAPSRRRVFAHFEGSREELPEALEPRAVCVGDPNAPLEGTNVTNLRVFAGSRGKSSVDLLASAVVPVGDDPNRARDALENTVRKLLPFSEKTLLRRPLSEPVWDSDALLADPPPRAGWPAACNPRISARPCIYALDREVGAGLGLEGDFLLGWRAGDAAAQELG